MTGRLVARWKESSPAESHLVVSPGLHLIRPDARHDVQMVAHHGIAANLDATQGCELSQPLADPGLAMVEVPARREVYPTEERPSHAADDAVIDADLVVSHDFVTRMSGARRLE